MATSSAKSAPIAAPGDLGALTRTILETNQREFLRAARGQRFAFATMKWMFLVVFVIAFGAMIAAVRLASTPPETGYDWAHAGTVAALAAMSLILFALLLYMRPLAALERNAVVQSFLTVVVNTYWTRLLHTDGAVSDAQLEEATAYTVGHLGALLDRQILGASKYMDLVRRAQDEAGRDPGAYASPL